MSVSETTNGDSMSTTEGGARAETTKIVTGWESRGPTPDEYRQVRGRDMAPGPGNGDRVLVAPPGGMAHPSLLRMVADAFEAAGACDVAHVMTDGRIYLED